ncbi:MAG: hypothetical protein K9J12_13325 [Melioribacteraceae bacterium]|nr:hypothetical protein [Melioribacteraceae bacterium]MCF8264291.1 hypothetical protein [Melioribacteraceae bacterium]MCF8431056.1 hypothetical protein [Melioribacteraceae bacterium]
MKKLVLLFLIAATISAQEKDPYELIEKVKSKFNQIQDYVVDVTISIDVNFLNVPESTAKLYFKKPDSVRLKSDGFALLPKEGMNFSPIGLFKGEYNAIYTKEEKLNGSMVDVIKVIPLDDSSQIILSTIWIDQTEHVIRKLESTSKKSGTLSISLSYQDKNQKILPSEVTFEFNVQDFQLPATITGEYNNTDPKDAKKRKNKYSGENITGSVTVKYQNYVINKGIEASIFEDNGK